MKWMRERDLLIAQTMAFVQSVTGRKPEAEVFVRTDIIEVTPTRLPDIEAMLAETIAPVVAPKPAGPAPLTPAPLTPALLTPASSTTAPLSEQPRTSLQEPRLASRSEYRSEIQARVEKFRAHQARINREREAYCSATMAKMQATLDSYPAPRPLK